MKYQLIQLLAIIALCPRISAELGCMSKSYDLKEEFDYKQYHQVKCSCPCKQYPHYFHEGYRCSKCGHAHDPELTNFVRNNYSVAGAAAYNPVNWHIARSLNSKKPLDKAATCPKHTCECPANTHRGCCIKNTVK